MTKEWKKVKAIGGSGIKKTCQAYFVELIFFFNAIFVSFSLKKSEKFNEIEKSQKFKIALPENFLYFFSAYACQISGL